MDVCKKKKLSLKAAVTDFNDERKLSDGTRQTAMRVRHATDVCKKKKLSLKAAVTDFNDERKIVGARQTAMRVRHVCKKKKLSLTSNYVNDDIT